MRVVVIGGTGLIGSQLVTKLCQRGHEALAACRCSGVNTITGMGLVGALEGADVVVDVVNSPSFESIAVQGFFERSSLNLRAAEAINAVRHHVALSVVGVDRLPASSYFRAKMTQEAIIRESGIPYTILRSTQVFEFMGHIAQSSGDGRAVHVCPALVQPVASDDVATALAEVTVGTPVNRTSEVAGPEKLRLDEVVRRVLSAKHDSRHVNTDARALYFGAKLNDRSLTAAPNARIAATSLESWISMSAPAASS